MRNEHFTILQQIFEIISDRIENPNNQVFLFSWDEIPGKDSNRFIEFLRLKFDIDWIKAEKIEKINDGKVINVFSENNYILLRLNNEETKTILTIDDGRTKEFDVKMENSKLNIYVGSYVRSILNSKKGSINKILEKIGEESTECIIAVKNNNKKEIISELTDLLFHIMILMVLCGVSWKDITTVLKDRHSK